MNDDNSFKYSTLSSKGLLLLAFVVSAIYVVNPFHIPAAISGIDSNIIFGGVVIAIWFLSNSLKKSVIFNKPKNDNQRQHLKLAYISSIAAALFIITGATMIFISSDRSSHLLGIGGVIIGLALQFLADCLYRPLLTLTDA